MYIYIYIYIHIYTYIYICIYIYMYLVLCRRPPFLNPKSKPYMRVELSDVSPVQGPVGDLHGLQDFGAESCARQLHEILDPPGSFQLESNAHGGPRSRACHVKLTSTQRQLGPSRTLVLILLELGNWLHRCLPGAGDAVSDASCKLRLRDGLGRLKQAVDMAQKAAVRCGRE